MDCLASLRDFLTLHSDRILEVFGLLVGLAYL